MSTFTVRVYVQVNARPHTQRVCDINVSRLAMPGISHYRGRLNSTADSSHFGIDCDVYLATGTIVCRCSLHRNNLKDEIYISPLLPVFTIRTSVLRMANQTQFLPSCTSILYDINLYLSFAVAYFLWAQVD